MGRFLSNPSAAQRTLKAVTMRGIFARCALAALLLAVTLAHDHHPDHSHDHDHTHDHSAVSGLTCHKLANPHADFGFALYKSLNANAASGKNIFFSPLGIATALSMMSTGAHGTTQSQLFATLGFSSYSQDQINKAYHHLLSMLGEAKEYRQLDVGNAVAVRDGFSPLQSFLQNAMHYYKGASFNVDFKKVEEATAEINRYIATKTQDKIKDMVKDLDPDMAMVLINYVFFRGQWEKPFNPNQTHKTHFHVDQTTKVEVDMMRRTGRYDFYQDYDNHTTVIRLPYKGNTSMLIVLPDEGKMNEVESFINKDYVRHWHDKLVKNSLSLHLPKFSIKADASLGETLNELGITEAFSDQADFSGISTEVKLKLSKVSHQAVLSVDETGTEAAAGTTLEIMPMSLPETVELNRPFMVFILEHSTRSILFMGKINNPTST
ncbi:alpha-1-antitrypsin-like [Solea senegalensis]|uniref:Alpha-1-antitrypsin-like n=1 Tax=Solea senegalensis TaxID=28829 RepID=A0AAV6RTU4_SOLSE|nr:alpha-1-antitrypsin homolog [Solea senegalensis]KAG7508449.1 alpha-1-antitrypsin-like [Solea senegalensis]